MPIAKAFIRPRPIRVAYLVEENEHWQATLEAVFAECFSRWGGRFSLIIPCKDREVSPAYLPWLESYDPDIVYSYVDLNDAALERLHEQLYPGFLKRHRFHGAERDWHAFRPQLPISPLSSLSVSLVAARGNVIAASQPVSLVDTHLGARPSPLLQENFGCYGQSHVPWPVARDMAPYVETVTVVPPEIQADPRKVPRVVTETVPTELALLERIARQRNLIGLSQLSAAHCPRLEIHNPGWTGQVNVFVGDSFCDRIGFWNCRSYQPVWLDNSIVTLKLARQDIENAESFAAIVGIIKDRIHIAEGGSNNSVVLRSASLPLAELEAVQDRFRTADKWNRYSAARIDSVDACAPDNVALRQAGILVEAGTPFQPSDWQELTYSEDSFRPPNIAPRHIRDVTPTPSGVRGAWAFDLDIERTTDYSRYQNVQHRWRLPRRLRMTSAFANGYTLGGSNGPVCIPRVTRAGLLGLFGDMEGSLPELKVPSDEIAFRHALCAPRDWLPFDYDRGPLRNSLVYDIGPSDKGRYFTALVRLSGGIHRAGEIFLNKFWMDQLEGLGATSSAGEERLPEVTRRLQNRLRAGAITTSEEWTRLARVVLTEARAVRLAPRYLRFDRLAERFEEFRDAYWSTHQPGVPREEWDADEKRSLAASVRYLCEQEILHQGHDWLCPHCKNNNWISIAALSKSMICEVCGATEAAPVAEAWRFKLNAFVLEGLRDHGLLAYLWCLAKLSDRAQSSFYYLEPHELFFTTDSAFQRRPDAEVDLIAVVDGAVYLCEVKSSNQSIDLEKLAELAKRIRPDVVTLAVMASDSPALRRRLSDLEALLAGTDIAAELIALAPQDIDDSPHLPTGRSFRVRLL